ncbi:MAG: antitoxin [Candidatus Binatia bacterium]
MSRLSIDVTPEQHQRLKAIAALHGQTIKEYVLMRALPDLPELETLSEEEALQRLEAFLQPRIAEARRGDVIARSVDEIFADVRSTAKS